MSDRDSLYKALEIEELTRRSYLKWATIAGGSIVATIRASDVASAASGYGAGGYGKGGYGRGSVMTVSTDSATDIGETKVTFNGSLDSLDDASSAACAFEYRKIDEESWQITPEQTLSSTGSFSVTMSGLMDGVKYEYRTVATTSDGDSATGSIYTFTTVEHAVDISTSDATGIGEIEATVSGSLDDLGNAVSADCYFEWRKSGSGSWTATDTQTLYTEGNFRKTISALDRGTTYEFRANATASDGDADEGDERSFTTLIAPTIDRLSVSEAGSPNPHADITTEWTVSDADAGLDTVSVTVTTSTGTTVDSAKTNVSGSDASGTDSFKVKFGDGKDYNVTLVVRDVDGNRTVETMTVTA